MVTARTQSDIDERFTTLAPPALVDARSAEYRPTVSRYGAVRFSATEASKPSGLDSSSPPGKLAPALFTRTSNRGTVAANSSTAAGSSRRSGGSHPGQIGVVLVGRRLGAGDGDLSAGIPEQCRGAVPDAAGTAGDQDRGAGEIEGDACGHECCSI